MYQKLCWVHYIDDFFHPIRQAAGDIDFDILSCHLSLSFPAVKLLCGLFKTEPSPKSIHWPTPVREFFVIFPAIEMILKGRHKPLDD